MLLHRDVIGVAFDLLRTVLNFMQPGLAYSACLVLDAGANDLQVITAIKGILGIVTVHR